METICVAGKGRIAIAATELIVRAAPHARVVALCNRDEDGVDRWQPSFRRYLNSRPDIQEIGLAEAQAIDKLTLVSVEFDRILRTERFGKGCRLYNIHFSLLPAYKGVYTSCLPILHGAEETGCTLHVIDPGIDTGPIIDQTAIAIDETTTAKRLYAEYVDAGIALLARNLDGLLSGAATATAQPSSESTYFGRASVNYADLQLDLRCTAWQLQRQVNAYNHRSYQLASFVGSPIHAVRILPDRSFARPGTIIAQDSGDATIATIDHDCVLVVDRFDRLIHAVEQEDIAVLDACVAADATLIAETGTRGWSPLMVAAYNGKLASVDRLLSHGADPNLANQKHTSPLMYAKDDFLRRGDDRILRRLVESGGDWRARDLFGRSLLDYVPHGQRSRVERVLAIER